MPTVAELDAAFFSFRTPSWKSRHRDDITWASERAALAAWRRYGLLGAPTLDLDFTRNGGFNDGLQVTAGDLLTTTRASTAYADTAAGVWSAFSSGIPRITDKGLLVEESRTNLFLNSGTPATQSITVVNGSVYTVSVVGTGSVTLSGAGTGTASQGSPVTFTASGTSLTVTTAGITGAFVNVNVELGSFATSPIRTTSAAATRAADVIVGPALTVGSALTLFAEMTAGGSATTQAVVQVDDGTSTNRVFLWRNNTTPSGNVRNTTDTAGLTNGTLAAGSTGKLAIAAATDDAAFCFNGGTVQTDATVTFPPGLNRLVLGQNGASAVSLNGYIRRVAYFPTRLPNATLQALTT